MMLAGDFMFAVNDVLGKWLVATYPPGEVLLMRSLAALALLIPLVWRTGPAQLARLERPGLQALRVATATGELLCFYAAIAFLPLADVMIFYLAGPLYIAAVSPWLTGERVGGRQWLAIAAGFAGVVIVLKPSAGAIDWPALLAIGGALCYASMVVQSRQLRATSDRVLVFWQTAGAGLVGACTAPLDWVSPSLADAVLLGTLGVVAMAAHICIARSLKLAPAAAVAPVQYSLLVWAMLFGWLVFGDLPQPSTIAGAAIIVGAGLMLVRNGRRPGGRGPDAMGRCHAIAAILGQVSRRFFLSFLEALR